MTYQTQKMKSRENSQTLRSSSVSPESALRNVVFPETGGPRSRVILKNNRSIDETREVSSEKKKTENHTRISEKLTNLDGLIIPLTSWSILTTLFFDGESNHSYYSLSRINSYYFSKARKQRKKTLTLDKENSGKKILSSNIMKLGITSTNFCFYSREKKINTFSTPNKISTLINRKETQM